MGKPATTNLPRTMSRRIDVPSFGLGAALATCVGAVLWMRVTPPWRPGALLSSALKRHAWDASVALCERRARPGRRPLRLFLIRHGQSLANTRPHLVGGRDEASPLSERGEDEARRLGERLAREFLRWLMFFFGLTNSFETENRPPLQSAIITDSFRTTHSSR